MSPFRSAVQASSPPLRVAVPRAATALATCGASRRFAQNEGMALVVLCGTPSPDVRRALPLFAQSVDVARGVPCQARASVEPGKKRGMSSKCVFRYGCN